MMEEEEYPSDSDQSDDDYKPEDRDSEQPSEIDSDGEPENDAVDEDAQTKPKDRKRKSIGARNGSKVKRSKLDKVVAEKEPEKSAETEEDDGEIDKAHADALWADFLNGTDTTASSTASSKSSQTKETKKETVTSVTSAKYEEKPVAKQVTAPPQKTTVKEIFEFAGEKIEVEKEIKLDEKNGNCKIKAGQVATASRPRPGGGLSSVLGQLGKKNKLSVLEKTKLDWTGFKKNEGIDDELQVHNKGRDGYLERQDFLERTDFRRFEIEKNLRQVTRRK